MACRVYEPCSKLWLAQCLSTVTTLNLPSLVSRARNSCSDLEDGMEAAPRLGQETPIEPSSEGWLKTTCDVCCLMICVLVIDFICQHIITRFITLSGIALGTSAYDN